MIKVLLALLCTIFWTLIFIQNIVPSGKFATSTDFTGVNPWLPGLRPIERVLNRNTIISDPIYMDIRLPARFNELRLKFDYDNQSDGDFRVGIFTNKDKWQILFGKYESGEYIFDLRGIFLEKNIVPVVLGTPKATVLKPVIVKKIEVAASKPAFTSKQFKELVSKPKFLIFDFGFLIIIACFLLLVVLPITASTFAVIVSVGSFLDAAVLEFWRPGFVANFVDSRIYILLFIASAIWYWIERRRTKS